MFALKLGQGHLRGRPSMSMIDVQHVTGQQT
jgi:hypothetical protein